MKQKIIIILEYAGLAALFVVALMLGFYMRAIFVIWIVENYVK